MLGFMADQIESAMEAIVRRFDEAGYTGSYRPAYSPHSRGEIETLILAEVS